ncbi:Kiwa anti-phage protein KwaB-like domain-containing protein [Brumimicrobium salinarum]|nr:Kiwa anti-phage protein KwaB-like domain-containing protein [Brumimicrobium salinarum]
MYIIERKKKAGVKTKAKPSEKFEYVPLQVDLSEELAPSIQDMLKKVINKKVRDDIEIKEYQVIDDTEDKIQTYKDLGKITGFKEFLNSRLGGEIKALKSFEKLAELEKAWAICYGFYSSEKQDWLYCIKKLAPRNMAVDQSLSKNLKGAMKNSINSVFDTTTSTLKPMNGFSINIEPSIDMIYFDQNIYIFNKKGFEDITSLTEEFIELSKELVEEVNDINFVNGIEHISSVILSKPSFRNKLIKAKDIGNIDFLKTCKNFKLEFNRAGKKLKIKFSYDVDGKINAKDEEEAKNIIQVISEFYKEGIFGGKVFETAAGRLKK